jgi:hypothetical protein
MSISLIRKGLLITLALAPVGLSEVKCRQESGTELLVSSTFKNGSGCSTHSSICSQKHREPSFTLIMTGTCRILAHPSRYFTILSLLDSLAPCPRASDAKFEPVDA